MISKSFWYNNPLDIGKNLLWKKISKQSLEWFINEVEIYKGNDDEASHAYKWKTSRNWPMFDEWWIMYVYLIYGIHFCFNISFWGTTWAVLIRSIKPVNWIEIMKTKRNKSLTKNLADWPWKFTQAFGITREYNGLSLFNPNNDIIIEDVWFNNFDFFQTERVGITKAKDKKRRFVMK